MSFRDATLITTAGTALYGIQRVGGIGPGETVAVIGPGPIGLMAVQLAKALGAGRVPVSYTHLDVYKRQVEEVLERQVRLNSAISAEGLAHPWGVGVGQMLLEAFGTDIKNRARAAAAAGSDARMGGCTLPVIINSGSGNQGITVSLPVVEYARALGCGRDRLYRALALANLCLLYTSRCV